MDITTLRAFFRWCTIINGGLLLFTAVICVSAPDWIYRVQSRWYPVSREAFNVVIYAFIGLFKVFFLMFNLVPYIVLSILG